MPDSSSVSLEIEIVVGAEGEPWDAHLAGCSSWQPRDLLADPGLLEDLETLRKHAHRPLPTDEHGHLSPEAAGVAAALQALAADLGDRLTDALLSPPARASLAKVVHANLSGEPPLLHLRVRPAGSGETAERRADRALALPWELLRLDGRFPVEEGTLDLAREAVVPDALGLGAPSQPLSVVAIAAAPVDATSLDLEEEMYRLWRALGRESADRRLLVTDLGTLEELAREVERFHPPVIHFSGHGGPGVLFFENEAALSDPVPVTRLARRLRETGPLPRLVYLSACHGATAGADTALIQRETQPSTAASLHRAGFPQVVAFFGPVGDRQATRAAAACYAALAAGKKAREALRRTRRISTEPHQEQGRFTHVYPLGWAQLAFYHRGEDVPTSLPSVSSEPPIDLGEERRRIFQRLDRKGGSERVEGIKGVQRLRFGFVGRRKERAEALRRWGRGERRLVVLGLGGLGKTALCTELAPLLARDLKAGGAPVLALDGRHAGAQPNPVLALWQEVQAAGSGEGWNQTLANLQEDGITGEALGKAVVELAKLQGGLLVYLDDAESLQVTLGEGEIGQFRDPELRRFWEILVEETSTADSLGLLVSSRYLPERTPRSDELHLPQLRRYEVIRLLSWMPTLGRLPAEDSAWLTEQIDGHPRTIEYLEVLARAQEESRVPPGSRYEREKWRTEILEPVLPKTREKVDADLLLGKLWEALPPEAQEHLGRCAVITAPAPWDAVLALQTVEGTAARLVETGMLSPFQALIGTEDWWAPHRLVAEEVRRRWAGDCQAAHRRLGEWYAQRFDEEEWQGWAERAVQHLTDAGDGNKAWPVARKLVIHLRTAGRYREALAWVERALAAAPTGPWLGKALAFQIQLGQLANVLPEHAEEVLLQALELVEPEDRSFVLDELGKLSLRKGELQKAAQYLEKSVQVEITQKGEDHWDVAVSLHTLAGVLHSQGDLDGARQNLERSLQIKAQVFSADIHPEVAASLHALAVVLQAQGDLDGARRNLERSLQIYAQVFGTDIHPSVAASLHALAGVLKDQGDLDGARRNLERSLQIKAQVFGTDIHPDIATYLHVLAGVLQDQGDLDGARRNLERSLQIYAQVFGTDIHPFVAASLHALAGVLKDQSDLDGAQRNLERSLQIKAQVFGTDIHPDVAASLHALAGVFQAQGDLDGARRNLERVIEIESVVYGTREHYSTAMTETNLGYLLLEQGETEAGAKLLAHAYSVFLSKLGPDHPHTRRLAPLFEKSPPQPQE
jgi:tetratricopeptide (TPR) repeat protein